MTASTLTTYSFGPTFSLSSATCRTLADLREAIDADATFDRIEFLRPEAPKLRSSYDPGADWPTLVRQLRQDHPTAVAERRAARERVTLWYALLYALGSAEPLPLNQTPAAIVLGLGIGAAADACSYCGSATLSMALTAIAVDHQGIGGERGLAGSATTRMGWAAQLGSGRRNAGSGGAWLSASAALLGEWQPSTDDVDALVGDHVSTALDARFVAAFCVASAADAGTPEESNAWVREAAAVVAVVARDSETNPDEVLGGCFYGWEQAISEQAAAKLASWAAISLDSQRLARVG